MHKKIQGNIGKAEKFLKIGIKEFQIQLGLLLHQLELKCELI